MLFFRIFQHLLPNARAWRLTVDKQLRQFFEGLEGLGADTKVFFDEVWLDIFPATTREITAWETQWNLPDSATLDDQMRRDRLDATWKATGGQSPRYLQDTLQAAGFNVFIHEWWIPGTESAPVARDPGDVLSDSISLFVLSCGAVDAVCGGSLVVCGALSVIPGSVLVNKPRTIVYNVPTDPDDFRYVLYFGGPTFGDIAQIDLVRREEFQELCLKICPAQQWIGLIVEYN